MILEDLIRRAASDMVTSKYAIVLTGAGMSTESGVPDFRGPQGIWARDSGAEAKAYQRYDLFLSDPKLYWEEMLDKRGTHGSFYGEVRKAEPNPGHYALAEFEKLGFVMSVITQNIDGLHEKAGNKNVIYYHGSVYKLRCASCGLRFDFDEDLLKKLPPYCSCGGIIKYDIVHFKESIPFDVLEQAQEEVSKCDLMLICGTSAVVYPFAALPQMSRSMNKSNLRIIEINSEPTPLTHEGISDYLIQGKTGEILPAIVDAVKKLQAN